jgi:V/A-type H+-transporting ATPase subunit C
MGSASESYLNTRVSAMATTLLDVDATAGLCRLSLPDLAEAHGLGAALDEQVPARGRARAVEQALLQRLLADLMILIRPMDAAGRGLLLAWARKYALFNLKTLIRGKLHGLDPAEIRENLFDLPERVRLPHQELFRAENVLELLRVLESGPLRVIARQARESYEQRRDPFVLESAVDQRYYMELTRQAMQFSADESQPVQHLLGALLDATNLAWLLRFRFSFGLSPSETFYQLVPSKRLLHRSRLLELVNLDSIEQVLEMLPEPLDRLLAGSTGLMDIEGRAAEHLLAECRRILARGQSGVARALAYLVVREHDLHLLYVVLQGRLLGLAQEQIDIAANLGALPPTSALAAAA